MSRPRRPALAALFVAALAVGGLGAAAVLAGTVDRIAGSAAAEQRAVRVASPVPPLTSGPLSSPHPTIRHLSVVWDTSRDSNGNSRVSVRFRPLGQSSWQPALALRRVPASSNEGFAWSDRHAGSIFGLQPATTYEIEATLTDPDGPDDVRTISATTRSIPAAVAGATVTAATPATLDTVLAATTPGDVVELSAGDYDGFDIPHSGRPGEPIVVRGLPGATVTGEVGVFDKAHVHVEGLTVNGRIRFNGSSNVAITRNTINADAALGGHGIVTFLRAEDAYIADNTVNGLTTWEESSLGASGDNIGEGILVTGPGHVIEHNRVRAMRDGISFLEDGDAVDQFSIDVLNNDVSESADDGIEADFCSHDCRIVGNRVTNSFVAMSSQPSFGGPTYFVNNSIYNVAHVAFKLYRGSQGDVLMHNTVVKGGDAFGVYAGRSVSHLFMRNNVFLGGPGRSYNGFSSGSGNVFSVADLDVATTDADHDGFGTMTDSFSGRFGAVTFTGLDELRARTSESNAVEVTLDVFADDIAFPSNALVRFDPPDLRLDPTSVAAGAAVELANVGTAGLGATPVAYGPR